MDDNQPNLSILQPGGGAGPPLQVKSSINQHLGQLVHFDIPASSLEAQGREETGCISTHTPRTGNIQVSHREQGDPTQSRRNVTGRLVA